MFLDYRERFSKGESFSWIRGTHFKHPLTEHAFFWRSDIHVSSYSFEYHSIGFYLKS